MPRSRRPPRRPASSRGGHGRARGASPTRRSRRSRSSSWAWSRAIDVEADADCASSCCRRSSAARRSSMIRDGGRRSARAFGRPVEVRSRSRRRGPRTGSRPRAARSCVARASRRRRTSGPGGRCRCSTCRGAAAGAVPLLRLARTTLENVFGPTQCRSIRPLRGLPPAVRGVQADLKSVELGRVRCSASTLNARTQSPLPASRRLPRSWAATRSRDRVVGALVDEDLARSRGRLQARRDVHRSRPRRRSACAARSRRCRR